MAADGAGPNYWAPTSCTHVNGRDPRRRRGTGSGRRASAGFRVVAEGLFAETSVACAVWFTFIWVLMHSRLGLWTAPSWHERVLKQVCLGLLRGRPPGAETGLVF